MSDNTRRETASTGLPRPEARPRPFRPATRHPAAPRLARSGRRGPVRAGTPGWPDARTAEALLAGGTAGPPPTVPADRLVRLLTAAREVRTTLDPAREAAALAAFRTAAAGRARGADGLPAAPGGSGGGRFAALRAAFAVRRPRMMAAAVVSALALGGVAVGVAAAARSLAPGGGAGTGPLQTRPPAAVSPDGGRTGPWTAGPATRTAAPQAPRGAAGKRGGQDGGHHSRGCYAADRRCPSGSGTARTGTGRGDRDGRGQGTRDGRSTRDGADTRDGKDDRGPRHTRPGWRAPSRAPGR